MTGRAAAEPDLTRSRPVAALLTQDSCATAVLRDAAHLALATRRPLLVLVALAGAGFTTDSAILLTRRRRQERTAQWIVDRAARADAGLSPDAHRHLATAGVIRVVTYSAANQRPSRLRWISRWWPTSPVGAGVHAATRAGAVALVAPACLHAGPAPSCAARSVPLGTQFDVVSWHPGTLVYVKRHRTAAELDGGPRSGRFGTPRRTGTVRGGAAGAGLDEPGLVSEGQP